jgi:hypothetical protein
MRFTDVGHSILVVLASSALISGAFAQSTKLPPPSRTVYKCVVNGKTTFSDDPCLGAEKIEVEPTRGVSNMTGQTRTGADVRREESRETFAEAVKPLTGMDAKELDRAGRRQQLQPAAREQCERLDRSIDTLEAQERIAGTNTRPGVQQQLLTERQRYRRLGC